MNDYAKSHTQEKGRGWCLGLAGFCTSAVKLRATGVFNHTA